MFECIWDPSPVVKCTIGRDIASIVSNWTPGIVITTGCGMVLLDTNKLVDEVIRGLDCNTLPTVNAAYLVADGATVVCLVTGGTNVCLIGFVDIPCSGSVFLVTEGKDGVLFKTGSGGAIVSVAGGGGVVLLKTESGGATFDLVAGGGGATVDLVTGGKGGVFLKTGSGGAFDLVAGGGATINLVTGSVDVVSLTRDAADVTDVAVELVDCKLATVTAAAVAVVVAVATVLVVMVVVLVGVGGGRGLDLAVRASFFTVTSFDCFTTFLVVTIVDARIKHTCKYSFSVKMQMP